MAGNGAGGLRPREISNLMEDTVTKCPACGIVTGGMPNRCPACGYAFADMEKTLPIHCDGTEDLSLRRGSGEREEKRFLPRHVVVPFLAGLLVALLVLVVSRMWAVDHDELSDGGSWTRAVSSGTETGKTGGQASREPPWLGPKEARVVPSLVTLRLRAPEGNLTEQLETSRMEEALVDSNPETCVAVGPDGIVHGIDFQFDPPARLSRIVIETDCASGSTSNFAGSFDGEVTVSLEDGTKRTISLRGARGELYVDLVGAWTSQVGLDLGGTGVVAIAGVEFYSFLPDGARESASR